MKQWCSTRIMLYIKTIILNTVSHNHFLKLLSTKKKYSYFTVTLYIGFGL